MKLTISKQIGQTRYPFTFEGDTLHDVIMASQQLAFSGVSQCDLCGGNTLYLRAYLTKPPNVYKYVVVCCAKPECRATLTFGQRKDDQAYFIRINDDKSPSWTPRKKNGDGDAQA